MTITKEHTIEALEWCIGKWESIISGDRPVEDGSKRCALCKLFQQEYNRDLMSPNRRYVEVTDATYTACKQCPLKLSGFWCISPGNCWYLYHDLEDDDYCDEASFCYGPIKDVSDPQAKAKLLFYARLMLRHLEICLENLNNG